MIKKYFLCFFCGILLTTSFAPFHMPGCAFVAFIIFFQILKNVNKAKCGFFMGFCLGLGFFGSGVSWVINSIHQYGQLNWILSIAITNIFIFYLALFPALATSFYISLKQNNKIFDILLFASLWTLSEFIRSILFTGFPWLIIGIGQIDSPLKHWLPIVGTYGVSFITLVIAKTFNEIIAKQNKLKNKLNTAITIILVTFILASPILDTILIKKNNDTKKLSVAIIQENLSMKDKWDENLFWKILLSYEEDIIRSLTKDIVLLPESAIPVEISQISNWLNQIQKEAAEKHSNILMGTISKTLAKNDARVNYHNSLISIGNSKGKYYKEHLVPFGEYIPIFFKNIIKYLHIPNSDFTAGNPKQALMMINKIPIISLICYEIAFDKNILKQVPKGHAIITITDSGWFGKSIASYQMQQISQVRSLQTDRYQILANNDGLSSIINNHGKIIEKLPYHKQGILYGKIYPKDSITIWSLFGNTPCVIIIHLVLIITLFKKRIIDLLLNKIKVMMTYL